MPRTTLATLLPLAALAAALLAPGQAVAGPPEGVSGAMAFDTVADELRKYRKEKDEEKRGLWLKKLALTHDPRVAVALGEGLKDISAEVRADAAQLLYHHYAFIGFREPLHFSEVEKWTLLWWKEHEADLRRRAKQLPQ